ncbi:GNAT family N-acetyltransferase [Gracilibacillus caseinilyticus]|uniref:GNAT family N-acetyltransferase n=1 Tax=Gracilibacillus caseinilyticus TaxID=2932256 RepID=A0ABY4EUX0_9BACI|nr:GNAT family N-acetyltransferase [Gracilibacillus caseinilyticus]UOQ47673.1 GNAT family N-acetyltransferase [Gracilibacillus caseinilyticus]
MEVRRLTNNEVPPMELLVEADPSPHLVQEYLKNGECYVMEHNRKIIGVYVLVSAGDSAVELVNIAIADKYRGQGLGKQLVQDAIQRAYKAGYKSIEVGTGNSSINQLALYQKCGFRLAAIDKDFFIRNYQQKIYENGIICRDMIRLRLDF